MIRNYLLLCLFGISACLLSSTAARESIIKGQIVSIHDFPYQVALLTRNRLICGGGIIGNSHILTAAHCVLEDDGQYINWGINIVAGISNLDRPDKSPVLGIVKRVFLPKEFSIAKINTSGDIAVLELRQPLDLKKHEQLKVLELPTRGVKHYIGKTGKVAGYGWNWVTLHDGKSNGSNDDGHLRFTEAHVLNDKDCIEIFDDINLQKEFCARVKQNKDGHFYGVCNGDSGGPFVLDGRTVIGILSRGTQDCSEEESSSTYTRVVHYLSFIENAIAGKPHHDIRTHVYQ